MRNRILEIIGNFYATYFLYTIQPTEFKFPPLIVFLLIINCYVIVLFLHWLYQLPLNIPLTDLIRYNAKFQQCLKVISTHLATYVTCAAELGNTEPIMFTVM
ncbi:hypothetical protein DPD72_20615 [Salmonella enterica subsp. salamae]|nr:hypothetical protein [Salmonella enterica subsp. salamae]